MPHSGNGMGYQADCPRCENVTRMCADPDVTVPAPVADLLADALPPGAARVTSSGVPLGKIPSRAGLLVWNGAEVEEVDAYPVDDRWIAWPCRDQRGGFWLAWHTFAGGEHQYSANSGPYPRVMVEEMLNRHPPVAGEEMPAGMTVPPPPDAAEIDAIALEAVAPGKEMDDGGSLWSIACEKGDDEEPQESAPEVGPEGWKS